jgi:predicted transcriptional regulator
MKKPVEIKELTKAELQIMQIMWKLGSAFVNDIIEELPEPKPAYNTVSTIIRILEKKGVVSHNSFGKTFQYFPLIKREEYIERYMGGVLSSFFSDSLSNLVSFFSKKENLSLEETDKILKILENHKKNSNGNGTF